MFVTSKTLWKEHVASFLSEYRNIYKKTFKLLIGLYELLIDRHDISYWEKDIQRIADVKYWLEKLWSHMLFNNSINSIQWSSQIAFN